MTQESQHRTPRVLGVILARGGSKSVPLKNIKPILGVPLIGYTIAEGLRSQYVSRLIVSTDSEAIRNTAMAYGAEAPFLRPAHLASDTASSQDAVLHATEWAEQQEGGEPYDYVVELMCTNPMKTSVDIDAALEKLMTTGADAVIGVTKLEDHHPIRIKKIEDDRIAEFCCQKEVPGSHRQQLKPDAYIRNGAIYATKRDAILKRISSPNSRPYVMPSERSVNIDTPNDFLLAEILLARFKRDYIQPVATTAPTGEAPSANYVPETKEEKRVLITTVPFGNYDRSPLDLFKEHNIDYTINPLGRKPTEEETIKMIGEYGIVLAGTSPFTRKVIGEAPHLKLIARAGIGLDNVDLEAAKEKGVRVTYTPQAPAPAVAEYTVGLMLSSLRHIPQANQDMHTGTWNKRIGRRLAEMTVGVMGTGSIGKLVISYLSGFGAKILAYDVAPDETFGNTFNVQWVDQKNLLRESDIVSLHAPLNADTRHMIGEEELGMMKNDAILINTARGGLIDEDALFQALQNKVIAGAAVDVFEEEPYAGALAQLDNCLLTSHMASASIDCKRAMETGATEEIIRFLKGEPWGPRSRKIDDNLN